LNVAIVPKQLNKRKKLQITSIVLASAKLASETKSAERERGREREGERERERERGGRERELASTILIERAVPA